MTYERVKQFLCIFYINIVAFSIDLIFNMMTNLISMLLFCIGNNSAVKHSPYSSLSSLEQTAAAVMTLVPNTPAGDLNTVNSAPAVIEVIEPLFMVKNVNNVPTCLMLTDYYITTMYMNVSCYFCFCLEF